MATRVGMTALIERLRAMTETVNDPEDEGNYFTDEQLQDELDRTAVEHVRVPLRPIPQVVSGNTNVYYDYYWSNTIGRDLERPDQSNYPNGNFRLQDSRGGLIFYGDGVEFFTVDWAVPKIVFGKDRAGHTFYMTVRSYNLNAAAAEIWLQKAGRRADLFQWKTDNHTMREDEVYDHCMKQYERYSSRRGGSRRSRFVRTDMNPYWG